MIPCCDFDASSRRDRDVAQLVEHWTGLLPTQAPFPGAARNFSPRQLALQTLLQCPYNPVCSCMHLNLCTRQRSHGSPCLSSVNYGNAKTSSMHHRLGSATLLLLAFSREDNLNFPWEKSCWDNSCKKYFLKVACHILDWTIWHVSGYYTNVTYFLRPWGFPLPPWHSKQTLEAFFLTLF